LLVFFFFFFFFFLLKHCYITFSLVVTGVNLLLDINHSYLDMIMFNYIKVFCLESSS